jgi:hypothetical protein
MYDVDFAYSALINVLYSLLCTVWWAFKLELLIFLSEHYALDAGTQMMMCTPGFVMKYV